VKTWILGLDGIDPLGLALRQSHAETTLHGLDEPLRAI